MICAALFILLIATQNLPLTFTQNKGQAPEHVRFLTQFAGRLIALTDEGADIHLTSTVLKVRLVGVARKAKLRGSGRLDELVRHVRTNPKDADDVPTFLSVRRESVYPDIDLLFYGRRNQLKHSFLIEAGANPQQIRFVIEGADNIDVDESGDLTIRAADDILRIKPPNAFQMTASEKKSVDLRFEVTNGNEVSFVLGDYDPQLPLTID